ncbi:cell death abnormality protein 1 [Microplitis demolitor]|uniref:cell death abnormality protein 1 n=1 Tax=Microplitis demolitor TaxID=69319 RepID=UPI00235B6091|nr:cell death abnormality protein 1 [Microplitis demolitor]
MPCKINADCNDFIKNSMCSEKKGCQCLKDYVSINETACIILYGAYCSSDEQCLLENSYCIDNACQCKPGYKRLGSKCESNCNTIRFSNCSIDKKCSCKDDYYKLNEKDCAPLLRGFCFRNEDCIVEKSICFNEKCQCESGYKSESNNRCIPVYSDKWCYHNEDCNQIQHAICSEDNVCVCISKYDRINETACGPLLKEYCDKSTDCATDNSICSGHECTCDDFFSRESNTRCLADFLGLSCKMNYDCKNIKYAKCSRDNRCVCHSNYIKVNNLKCAPYIGEYCEHDSECFVNGTFCIRNKCSHDPSSISKDNQKHSLPSLNEPCKHNADCNEIKNAVCSENKKCVCKPYYSQYNRTRCTSLSQDFCSKNRDCLVENSACIDNFCKCKPNFIKASNHLCILQSSEKFCLTDQDCSDLLHTYCSNDRKCVCESNYFSFGSTCLVKLRRSCDNYDDCFDQNSVCYMNNCLCKPAYVVRNYQCEHVILGAPCKQHSDCSLIPNAVCSNDQKCVCNVQSYALSTVACAPMIGASCSFDNKCHFENSECFSNSSCQCLTKFAPVSETQCFPKILLSVCEVNLDCGEPWHHECTEDKKCVCRQNNIAINRSTCLPILGANVAWSNDFSKQML